ARPTARLESESPATLTHAAHLENLRGRKLVEVADERMARVSSFGDVDFGAFKSGNDLAKLAAETAIAAIRRDDRDFLLHRALMQVLIPRLNQNQDFKRRKVLPRIRRLLERERCFTLNDKKIEVFAHDDVNRFVHRAHNSEFHVGQKAENRQYSILE